MGQHATIHGKTIEPFNGQDGKWVPIRTNSEGQIGTQLLSGELQQFNRLAGGAIVQKALVSADGLVVAGACIFYGLKVKTAGTTIDVYDSITASGNKIIDAEATTAAGAILTPAGQGVGVLMSTGIYVDLTGGTYWIYYVPVA